MAFSGTLFKDRPIFLVGAVLCCSHYGVVAVLLNEFVFVDEQSRSFLLLFSFETCKSGGPAVAHVRLQ